MASAKSPGLDCAKPRSIGLIRLTALGDTVLASRAILLLSANNPQLRLRFWTSAAALAMMQPLFPQVEWLDAAAANWGSLHDVELLLDLQNSGRSRRLLKALRRSGCCASVMRVDKHSWFRLGEVAQARWRGRRQLRRVGAGPPSVTQRIEALCEEAARWGGWPFSASGDVAAGPVWPQQTSDLAAERLPSGIPWLGIGLGASYPAKQAPWELWQRVLLQLARGTSPCRVALFGTAQDSSAAATLRRSLSRCAQDPAWMVDLTGQLESSELPAHLARCTLFLGNDSALVHVAEAVGCPVGVVMGPTVPSFGFAPWRPQSRVFEVEALGCRPCSRHGKRTCRYGDHLCFRDISPSEIAVFSEMHLDRVARVSRSGS